MNMLWSWEQGITKSGLEPTTRLLLFTLATYMNKHGKSCFPSVPEIASASGLAERTVTKHIGVASKAGWIVVSKRREHGAKWDHNYYEAAWPQGGASGAGVQETAKGGASDADKQPSNNPDIRYPLPIDWKPKGEILNDCLDVGFTEAELKSIIDGFIDYWSGEANTRKGKKTGRGWNAAFRNRINSLEKQWSVRFRKKSGTANRGGSARNQQKPESLAETALRMVQEGRL